MTRAIYYFTGQLKHNFSLTWEPSPVSQNVTVTFSTLARTFIAVSLTTDSNVTHILSSYLSQYLDVFYVAVFLPSVITQYGLIL